MKIVKQRNLYITIYTAMNLNLRVVYIQNFLYEWNFNLFEGEENKHMGNNQIVQRFNPMKIKIINLYFHVNIAMC